MKTLRKILVVDDDPFGHIDDAKDVYEEAIPAAMNEQ